MKETYKNLQGLLQKQNAMINTVEYTSMCWQVLQQWWLCRKVDTLQSVAFNVNGTAERGTAITEFNVNGTAERGTAITEFKKCPLSSEATPR
jgi:spore germination protein YaaH